MRFVSSAIVYKPLAEKTSGISLSGAELVQYNVAQDVRRQQIVCIVGNVCLWTHVFAGKDEFDQPGLAVYFVN